MLKRISCFVAAGMVLFLLIGCKAYDTQNAKIQQQTKQEMHADNKETDSDNISDKIKEMTLDEKIGQLVITGVDGYTANEHSKELIDRYHVGGFILLGHNVKDTNQVLKLINSLKAASAKSGKSIPLFLGVDQEGGRVDRMPHGFKRLPSNKAIGKINSSSYSYSIGKILGKEVKAFGYNIDFAPVLDINSNPKNTVIGDRSFGPSPEVVTKLGIQTMKGIQSQNIISAAKHFPGHGDTSVDSHTGLPIVNNDLKRLKNFELVPFEEAIQNNVDIIMAAHILFPKIDSKYPASMSKIILTNVLRDDMGYKGIIMTDDMTMGAIAKNYNLGEAAVISVNAGSNIILVCNDFSKEVQVITALKAAVKSGKLSQETIDNSVYLILKLKQKYKIADKTVKSVDIGSINKLVRSTLK